MKNSYIFVFSLLLLNLCIVRTQLTCTTPNGELATCIRVDACKILYDATSTQDPQVIKFLRASVCGSTNNTRPLVCCGTTASYASPPTLVRGSTLLPNTNSCGLKVQVESRIFGGEDTSPDEYPWTALIRYRNTSGLEQFGCGASLINNRYIITAAHCVMGSILDVVGNPVLVRLGEYNTETDPDCITKSNIQLCSDKHVDYGIAEITAHKEYNYTSANRQHDIALIRLDRLVLFTDYIRPVCLPLSTDEVRDYQILDVVGWGLTERGSFSTIKQKLAVPVVPLSECQSKYRKAGASIRKTQLCAGSERGKDSCTRDSGGPLTGEKSGGIILYGVVSFGPNVCGAEGWPGIYTKVSEYRSWIEDNIFEYL